VSRLPRVVQPQREQAEQLELAQQQPVLEAQEPARAGLSA
jgi:hypothetical protein